MDEKHANALSSSSLLHHPKASSHSYRTSISDPMASMTDLHSRHFAEHEAEGRRSSPSSHRAGSCFRSFRSSSVSEAVSSRRRNNNHLHVYIKRGSTTPKRLQRSRSERPRSRSRERGATSRPNRNHRRRPQGIACEVDSRSGLKSPAPSFMIVQGSKGHNVAFYRKWASIMSEQELSVCIPPELARDHKSKKSSKSTREVTSRSRSSSSSEQSSNSISIDLTDFMVIDEA